MDSEVEAFKEAGMLVSLSIVHMFCVSVLRSLTIRNAWNAIVPSVFGFREISRKEASTLRFLFSAITRNSYTEQKDKTTPKAKELAMKLVTGVAFEIVLFIVSVLSLRQVRKANAKVEAN